MHLTPHLMHLIQTTILYKTTRTDFLKICNWHSTADVHNALYYNENFSVCQLGSGDNMPVGPVRLAEEAQD